MTQRQEKRRGRRLRAEGLRRVKIEEAVRARAPEFARAWLDAHPPRPAVPVELGEWSRSPTCGPSYDVEFFGFEKRDDGRWRPRGALVQVLVYDRRSDSVLGPPSEIPSFARQTILMRPIQMGLSHGQTRVRWWNWEPTRGAFVGEVESELVRAASKMAAMLGRVKAVAEQSGLFRDLLERPGYEMAMAEEGLRFVGELLEAIEQWSGRARGVYSVPGWRPGDPPEERAR